MTFKATEVIDCVYFGKIIRFRRKNSYIDLKLSTFEAIANLNGAIAIYKVEYKGDVVTLIWEVRKKLKRERGIILGNNICIEREVNYFNSGSYKIEYINDVIAIVTLRFLSKEMRERLCYILSANVGIPIKCIYTGIKDSVFAFETNDYNSEIDQRLNICLKNILKSQNIGIDKTDKKKGANGTAYYVTLAVV